MKHVEIVPIQIARMAELIGPDRFRLLKETAAEVQQFFGGRVLWNVNSTATGGGVAEMLQVILAYGRGVGVDTRWSVLEGESHFYATTKRLHNLIHGMAGDGRGLTEADRQNYEEVLDRNLKDILHEIGDRDVMLLHDPQTAGLVPGLKARGISVIWRCHIGRDAPNDLTQEAWDFLCPYLEQADRIVVSREAHVPPGIPSDKVVLIPPSIDPFAAKNAELSAEECVQVLARIGLLDVDVDVTPIHFPRRGDGMAALTEIDAAQIDGGPVPSGAPLVVQVSRWDRLKDMPGAMKGFVECADIPDSAHLVLCGPEVSGVTDDPEGAEVFEECQKIWRDLDDRCRSRVHLVCLPMGDVDANAHMVNALQRYASVVVQKSLFEGFGLTVTEAMWKSRPMVASAVGGIQDQIEDGVNGLLVHDPEDLAEFGAAVSRLLNDPAYAEELGKAARERVIDMYLGDRHLLQYADMLREL